MNYSNLRGRINQYVVKTGASLVLLLLLSLTKTHIGGQSALAQGVAGKTAETAAESTEGSQVRSGTDDKQGDAVAILKEQVAIQQKQIELLQSQLEEQRKVLERTSQSLQALFGERGSLGQVASLEPVVLSGASGVGTLPAIQSSVNSPAPAASEEVKKVLPKVEDTSKKVDGALKSLGGFKFSGDFRFRADVQARSANAVAGPLQNVRSRYRVRLNLDNELDPRFKFHLQLSTGPLNNGLTNDQDFAGTVVKHPFSLAEAYIDFHPSKNFSIRGGRMEEIFADNTRFLWDDDVRFNGFQQIVRLPFDSNNSVELRAGEYWFANPNVAILSPSSPLVGAGFAPGQKVRSANLFHPGVMVNLGTGGVWKHQISTDVQLYRNPNQIQLASLADGFPILVSNAIGLALSGPVTGLGNATTTPGGAMYTAPDFHIVRAAYRLAHRGVKVGDREMPLWFDFQVARNYSARSLGDALIGSVNFGAVKKAGDLRFLYQYAIKDANALISQFTDDDLGTGTGVNIGVHALRFDVGLTHFLQWQNLLFIQHERRANNPAEFFFVPLQRGANPTFRYLGQLAFTF
jgi:uncharacterized coiled-coil protein SlyX